MNIEDNIVTYEFQGDRAALDRVKIAYLADDGREYLGYNAVSVNASLYYEAQKGNLSDERLKQLIGQIDIMNPQVKMIYKVAVCGPVSRVVFYTLADFKETKMPFAIDYTVQ